mgnify:CR=1 FL=1
MTKGMLYRSTICSACLVITSLSSGCVTSRPPLRESEVPVWLEEGKAAPFSGLLIQEGEFAALFQAEGRKILDAAKGN